MVQPTACQRGRGTSERELADPHLARSALGVPRSRGQCAVPAREPCAARFQLADAIHEVL